MGRNYAGTLGLLACLVVVVRGLFDGGDLENTIWWASLCLFGFAAIGYVAGRLASWIIRESVQAQMNVELEAVLGPAKENKSATQEQPAASN